LFVVVLAVVIIGGFTIIIVVKGLACDKHCASVPCTEAQPCVVAGKTYTVGVVCAPGVEGSVCLDHTWPFADCTCGNTIGRGNVPKAVCYK
jgi:hypothetical protein